MTDVNGRPVPSQHPTPQSTAAPTLRRGLTSRQIGMVTIGGVIGTGLFLGGGLAVSLAGPAVLLAYAAGSIIALALMYAATEMASAHPDLNGFGALTHRYLGPFAGFVHRWMYWGVVVVTTGAQAVAVGVYLRYWWPQLPLWTPVVVCALLVVTINLSPVRLFGTFEYWFSAVKVTAIVVFVLLGTAYLTVGLPGHPTAGWAAWTDPSGYLPFGLVGLWTALIIAMFSFGGTEALALTAAESTDPRRTLPRAARWTILRLAAFYLLAMAVIVSISGASGQVPDGRLEASPFVQVLSMIGLPAASAVMNFVVLTAALSALNAILYLASRTLHSLGTDRQAPAWTARVSRRGVPVSAVLASAVGLGLATMVSLWSPDDAFVQMLGLSSFGGLATWAIIFVTHIAFRRRQPPDDPPRLPLRLPGAPWTSAAGAAILVLMIVSMLFVPMFRTAWFVGAPCVALIVVAYLVAQRRRPADRPGPERMAQV